jgi:CubicO group peptidase (beta-lactamase class C family)
MLETVRHRLAAEVAAGRLPGAVVMVACEERPLATTTVGWLDATLPLAQRVPMPANAVFRIYSMTKPLTSIAAMMLVEQGRLHLHDTLGDLLPTAVWQAGARAIRVLDLLRHTSGLTYGARAAQPHVRAGYLRLQVPLNPRDITSADLLQRISKVPLLFEPGSTWEYGNSTDVLGLVIEAVSGERLGHFLQEQLFKPMGLTDTGFTLAADQAHRLAQPFSLDPVDGTALDVPNQTFDPTVAARMDSGGAGALSTAPDYLRLARLLASHGTLDGVCILQPHTVAEMTRDWLGPTQVSTPVEPGVAAINSPGYGFGLGFAVRLAGDRANVPGSPGTFFWSGTAGTLFWVDPVERFAAVYMSQAPGASRLGYRRLIKELVYDAVRQARRTGAPTCR